MKLSFNDLLNSGKQPRVHGNGFIQLDLDNLGNTRLHVWPCDDSIPKQKVSTQIHDHGYSFYSYIITGQLENYQYDECYVIFHEMNGIPYHVYNAVPRKDQDTLLVDTQEIIRIKPTFKQLLSPKSQYFFPAYKFHESKAVQFTATIMSKAIIDKDYNPSILVSEGEIPDNEFTRFDANPEILWKHIEKAWNLLSLSNNKRSDEIIDIDNLFTKF